MKKGMKRMLSLAVALLVLVSSGPMNTLSVYATQTPDRPETPAPHIEGVEQTPNREWSNEAIKITGTLVDGTDATDTTPYKVRFSTQENDYSHDSYDHLANAKVYEVVSNNNRDFTITTPETGMYYFWAYDGNKQKTERHTVTIKIDTIKPEVNSIASDVTTSETNVTGKDVTISGTVSDDGGSQIEKVMYSTVDGIFGTDEFTKTSDDAHKATLDEHGNYSFVLKETMKGYVSVWTYDKAGNKCSEPKKVYVHIDKTQPIITEITDSAGGSWKKETNTQIPKWGNTDETITVTTKAVPGTDGVISPVNLIRYGTTKNYEQGTDVTVDDDGKFRFTISKEDVGVNRTYYIWAKNARDAMTADPIPYQVQIDTYTPEIKGYTFEEINDGVIASFTRWITGGIFCKKEVKVTVTASDQNKDYPNYESSGVESINLYTTDDEKKVDLTKPEKVATGNDLTEFEQDGIKYVKASFTLTGSKDEVYQKYISANVRDNAGNQPSTVARPSDFKEGKGKSNKVVLEQIAPQVVVTQNESADNYKKTDSGYVYYKGDASFTVEVTDQDTGIESVDITVNGEKITTDSKNQAILTKEKTEKETPIESVTYIISTKDIKANEEGEFQIAVKATDNAGNPSTVMNCMAKQDIEKPEITKMTFASKEAALKEKTDVIKTNYGYFFQKDTQVTIEAKDNETGSGVAKIYYYFIDAKGNPSEVKNIETKRTNQIQFTIPAGFKGYIVTYAEDNVGYQSKEKHPDAVIVETLDMHSKDASLTMDIKNKTTKKDANGLDLYAGAVNVDCAFADSISGLSNITYQVKDGTTGELLGEGSVSVNGEGDLVDNTGEFKTVTEDENLVTKISKSISVADDHNNIKVSAILTDRAGYKTSQEVNFSIDTTAPTIEVTYDNNSFDKDFANETQYYKEGRTATITVTERNFKEEDLDITAANSDGAAPTISGWTKHENSDPNQTTYTATVDYTKEGDYTFGMGFTDLAGNQAQSIATQKFTVDTTVPTVQVTYDNNQAQTETFYKEGRTATITINEHNFETSRIKSVLTAKDGGAAPAISSFSSNGDIHTATISFTDDQVYTFDLDYTDKAGHQAADLQEITFCVDKTMPVLTVTGIKNYSANSGRDASTREETNVGFVVEASDTNFAGLTPHLSLVTLEGTQNCDDLLGGAQGFANGQRYAVTNLKKDGIYILTASVTDKAGNENKAARVTGADGTVIEAEQIVFSVNRNGSVYTLGEDTQKINGSYLTQEQDIVIRETNVNALTQRKLTLFKDNQTMILEEGKDFKIDKTEGNGQWNQYTYTIFKQNFVNDGYYSLAVYSVDAANNESENNLDTKDMELRFAIDKTAPKVIVTDLADEETYKAAKKDVTMVIDDNMKLQEVKVYHATYDGDQSEAEYGEATTTWNTEQIQEMVANNQDFTFRIDGNTAEKHKVKIVAVDAAGTEKEVEVKDFYITEKMVLGAQITNLAKKNPLPIVAILVVVVCGIGAGVVLVARRKKTTAE